MEIENQVVSLELAKKLKELGVKQDSLFYWERENEFALEKDDEWCLSYKSEMIYCEPEDRCISAFTVAELFELLPVETNLEKQIKNQWFSKYYQIGSDSIGGDTPANCLANMLIYLLENNLIQV